MAEEKTGRRERKKQQSRAEILAAAVQNFAEKGYNKTSIADIMETADLGTGTFYNYFSSKEEILQCLLGRLVVQVDDALRENRAAGRSQLELLAIACQITAAFLDENRFVLPLFLSAPTSPVPEQPQGKVPAPGFKPVYMDIIVAGQRNGEIRTDIPADLIAEMFHSIFQAAAFSKLKLSFQENVALKTRLLLDGIRNPGKN